MKPPPKCRRAGPERVRPAATTPAAELMPEPNNTAHGGSAYESRQGNVIRATSQRTTTAHCLGCDARFGNVGAAASHARGARHITTVAYSATFSFMPIGGGR
jgi:hypothetical protein